MPNAILRNNIASIDFRDVSVAIGCTVKTNSPAVQRVTVTKQGQAVYQFEGKGERNLIGQETFNGGSALDWTFEYGVSDFRPSSLRSGGPYAIGKSNFLIIVAENGDDSDFNDVVVQFDWKSS